MPRKKAEVKAPVLEEGRTFRCLRCGSEFNNPVGHFYKVQWSELYKSNENYAPLCRDCCQEIFESISRRRSSDREACIVLCHLLDVPFFHSLYDSIVDSNNIFSIGLYLRQMNNKQYQFKDFSHSIFNFELVKSKDEIRDEKEIKWTTSDIKNKNYVIQSLGYDCYDDENYNDEDRRFLFNTLSGYLDDDVLEDPHKTQSAIRMVETILQSKKISNLINSELNSKTPSHNFKGYAETKAKLDGLINSSAADNGFSVKGGGRSQKGLNTLTGIMREMLENDYEECKVNIFDVKMSDAMKKIAEISDRSLFDQLNYQSDDYARMVATQREIIKKYEEDKITLEEDLRLAKVKILELENREEGD